MASDVDFLATAGRLIPAGQGRPPRGDLRRAVSTAYYHLFHLLTREAARLFAADDLLVAKVARAISHKTVKEVSESFRDATAIPSRTAVQKLPAALHGPWLSNVEITVVSDVNLIADAAVRLQQERHVADYDLSSPIRKAEAQLAFKTCKDACDAIARVRSADLFRLYVGTFFCKEAWVASR